MAGMAGLEVLQALVDGSKHQTEVMGRLDLIVANQGRVLAAVEDLGGRLSRLETLMAEKVADSDACATAALKIDETAAQFPAQVQALVARIEVSERVVAAALGSGLGSGISSATDKMSAALLHRLGAALAESRDAQAVASAESRDAQARAAAAAFDAQVRVLS